MASMTRPAGPVLIVGAMTWDVFGGERRPGGAVSFAARAAAALGVRARILTISGADADLAAFEDMKCMSFPPSRR